MDKKKMAFYYGIILIAVGLGVFYRIPAVMQQVAAIEFFSTKLFIVKFCFYMLGIFLVVAGGIRVYKNLNIQR
ncbi:MAG: hypothetical protein K9K21_04875 [Desulfotignum sp.]|nr:hypothetical protein [Desulfotignum sp.]MCF8113172.1 hypothetical protein [Desulfotignum sp.]MCF8125363.1 hypothetical protein [Desulfotignum sp.]